jgi:hypothetical protein
VGNNPRKSATMITRKCLFVTLTAVIASAAAARADSISEEEFGQLKQQVLEQGKRLDQLEQAHQRDQRTLQENERTHEADQQDIEKLKREISDARKTAERVQQAAQSAQVQPVQPVHPLPPTPAATHNFTMVGDAEIQFGRANGSHGAFALADFAPILLFRAHDNILFEAGLDVTLQNNSASTASGANHDSGSTTSIGLSFATLDYMVNDYCTVLGGLLLLPLGTYSERSAGWLNKIPDAPLPRDLVPGGGVGAELRGAISVGTPGQSLTYAVYAANGPSSSDGTAHHDQLDLGGNVGIQSDGNLGNLHASPSAGGRVGWFKPWRAHYDLELGLSGQTGTWDDDDRHRWSAAGIDAALHLGPTLELKGEYLRTWLDTSDAGTLHPRGWWVQGSYKLAGLNLDSALINNLEFVGRYDTKHDDSASIHTDRFTIGYVYYLTNTLLFEGDYEFHHSNDPVEDKNRFVFQLSYGF